MELALLFTIVLIWYYGHAVVVRLEHHKLALREADTTLKGLVELVERVQEKIARLDDISQISFDVSEIRREIAPSEFPNPRSLLGQAFRKADVERRRAQESASDRDDGTKDHDR